ncbi:hypothetical protein ACFL5O_11330 [Myxococcota bacterium]
MRTVYWGIGLGAVALLSLTVLAADRLRSSAGLRATSGNSSDSPSGESAQVEELQREVQSLRNQMARIQVAQLAVAQAALNAPPDPDSTSENAGQPQEGEPSEEEPEDVQRAKEDQRRIERYARLADRVSTEPRDSAWADTAESEIAAAMAFVRDAGCKDARLESAQCASTLCRATMVCDSVNEGRSAVAAFRPLGFERGTRHSYEENGQYKTVAYFGKAGHQL